MVKSGKITVWTILIFCCLVSTAFSQENNVYTDMSLEELLNVDVVVTASKKPEDLFDTPLSVTIVKKEDIVKAGCTSIMEALRLSPGLIVRETSPGNFDIHIRGFDDMNKNHYVALPMNTIILVMIDNRTVYSYFSGGTFWETLPIDIHDVERIEVVRGPASALYGPNAANGVINIITNHAKEQGLNSFASLSGGNLGAKNANASVGYNWNDKTRLTFSGNYAERYRFQDTYYSWSSKTYVNVDDLGLVVPMLKDSANRTGYSYQDFRDTLKSYYNTDLSLQKMGANLFFSHEFKEGVKIDLATGAQNSQCQKPGFMTFCTPLSQDKSKSYYFDGRLALNSFFAQLSMSTGEDINNYKYNSFKYNLLDFNTEYSLQLKSLNIRPGFNFRWAQYNSPITYNKPFNLTTMNYQFKDEPREMNDLGLSLLTEWKVVPSLRLIGGMRLDKFDINKNYMFNYEIGTTWRINKNNLVRAVHSKANRSPFIFDTYLNAKTDLNWTINLGEGNEDYKLYVEQNFFSKRDLKYPTITSFEVCWRNKISQQVNFDVEMFTSNFKNPLMPVNYREIGVTTNLATDSIIYGYAIGKLYAENYKLSSRQNGITFTVSYSPDDKTQIRLYGTLQQTKLKGRTKVEYTPQSSKFDYDTANQTATLIIYDYVNSSIWSVHSAPTFYGGLVVNYQLFDKWNLNANAYFHTKEVFAGCSFDNMTGDYTGRDGKYFMTIKPMAEVNAKVSYQPWSRFTLFLTGQNLLGKHRQFGFTDEIGTTILFGVQWGF